MNFYFNYFITIGREQSNCLLSTVHTCIVSFPEKGYEVLSPPSRHPIPEQTWQKSCIFKKHFVSLYSKYKGMKNDIKTSHTVKRLLLTLACLTACATASWAQPSPVQALLSYVQNAYQFSQVCQQEKVYLHFDNTAYFQGDVIWFTAYVVNASTHTPAQSKVLYVELLSPNGVVLRQLKLKVENGQAHGSLPLVDVSTEEARALRGVMALPSGFYEVRAYTRTMLNFGDAGVFSRVFPVYEAPEKEGDYTEPTMARWDNPYDKQRPEAERPAQLNVTFYPEGGNLVMGLPCRIAFKAMDSNGQGVAASGTLTTDEGTAIAVETAHDGMGSFNFIPTKKRHTVEFTHGGKKYTFRLPEATDKGYTLYADNLRPAQLRCQLRGHHGCPDELLGVMLISRGAVCYFDTLSIRGGTATLIIPKEKLPTGVHQLTLFNAEGRIFSQRHLFINNGIESGQIAISTTTTQPEPYAPVTLGIQTTAPDGTPLPATISLAVRDQQDLGTAYSDNLLTNMLLSSDLKGYIHHPEYYFESTDAQHTRALDLLMMTQGWTRYNWAQMARVEPFHIKHYVEDGLVIDGCVLGRMRDVPVVNATVKLRLYSPDRSQRQETTVVTDENGCFGFAVEEFNDKWDMFITVTKDDKEIDCRLRLDRASRPTLQAYAPATTYLPKHAADTTTYAAKEKDPFMQALPDSVFLLDNVDVHGRKKYVDFLTFKAYNTEEDTELHLDQGRHTYTVRDYLIDKGYNIDLSRYDGVVPHTLTTRDEVMAWSLEQCPINNRRVLWYLHNNDSKWMKESYIPGFDIDMQDVKSIIVYDSPFEFTSHPIVRQALADSVINLCNQNDNDKQLIRGLYIIDITMYPKGLRPSRVKGQRQTTFRGYSTIAEYYAPEYPNGPIKGDVDYRRTLYWNPALTTDANGHAQVLYYNNSYSKRHTISAEGMTPQGMVLQGKQ